MSTITDNFERFILICDHFGLHLTEEDVQAFDLTYIHRNKSLFSRIRAVFIRKDVKAQGVNLTAIQYGLSVQSVYRLCKKDKK